jgi:hypothetical protein
MIKQQFEVTPGYRKWTLGLLGVGGLVLLLGIFFLALSPDEHNQTRFWAVLLQNSTFFLLVVNASMFFICITTMAMGGWQMAFRSTRQFPLGTYFDVLALIVFIGYFWTSTYLSLDR